MTSALSRPPTGRALAVPAAAALAAVCVVHMLDGPGSLSDHFYIGALELALAAACAPLAIWLVIRPVRAVWNTALCLNVVAMAAFIASRTVGLPGSTDDIGHWAQVLGVINLAVEAIVIATALACATRFRASEPNGDAAATDRRSATGLRE